jgi:hypothetical protein
VRLLARYGSPFARLKSYYFIHPIKDIFMKRLIFPFIIGLLFTGCDNDDDGDFNNSADIVYIQTNDFNSNQNDILA